MLPKQADQMQPPRKPLASKYLTKSKTVMHEMNSYQSKRHNFIGKQMDANNGNMPVLNMSDYLGRDRSSSNNNQSITLSNNNRSLSNNTRNSILITPDQLAVEQIKSSGTSQLAQQSSGEKQRKRWNIDIEVDQTFTGGSQT